MTATPLYMETVSFNGKLYQRFMYMRVYDMTYHWSDWKSLSDAEGKGTQLSVPGNPSHSHQQGEQETSRYVEGIPDPPTDY